MFKSIKNMLKIYTMLQEQRQEIDQLKSNLTQELEQLRSDYKTVIERLDHEFSLDQLDIMSHRLKRNFLPNDDAAMQKTLMAIWRLGSDSVIGYKELLESGFRVFSQNDEDGILLRIFSHIGYANQMIIEIGSNCSDSEIGLPENLSTNLIVNHGWHGVVFEIDQTECDRLRYFFARDFSTKHFHMTYNGEHGYFSPLIFQNEISPENIDQVLRDANDEAEPDLMVIDIDGGEYSVIKRMTAVRPRVLVVEFEKRFRDKYSVVQFDITAFSRKWPQSGTVSLPAWEKLMEARGYSLCAISASGFNAFFVRSDIAAGKFSSITSDKAFDGHPILSKVQDEFWLSPDESWETV